MKQKKFSLYLTWLLFLSMLILPHPVYSMHFFFKKEIAPYENYHPVANRSYCRKRQCFSPDTSLKSYQKKGIASWYGRPFHGRKTSTGEKYNMFSYTAASPTLPVPSYAKVTNLANKKTVIVRINDRGPFVKGRLIDLSYGAAHKLGFSSQGTAEVHVQWIHPSKLSQLLKKTKSSEVIQKKTRNLKKKAISSLPITRSTEKIKNTITIHSKYKH